MEITKMYIIHMFFNIFEIIAKKNKILKLFRQILVY